MADDEVVTSMEALVEELAAVEHERWAHWQRYMHQQGQRQPDGSLILPPGLVTRWERQMWTSYSDLADQEKESDREQVLRYLPILLAAVESSRLRLESGNRAPRSRGGGGPRHRELPAS